MQPHAGIRRALGHERLREARDIHGDIRREMLRHAQDRVLQRLRRKDVRIDALEDEPDPALRLDLERVVDVPGTVAAHVRLVGDPHRRQRRGQLLTGIDSIRH